MNDCQGGRPPNTFDYGLMQTFDFDNWVREHRLEMFADWLKREHFDTPDALALLREADLLNEKFALGDVRRLLHAVSRFEEEDSGGASKTGIEKRIISVLFCDLVNSTEFVRRSDHVDMHSVFANFQKRCTDIVHKYDGYVARYLGDGVLVYFGYPSTGENDAARAINAGLEIAGHATSLDNSLPEHPVRVGVATGLVAVGGDVGYQNPQGAIAIGESVHLAARLQAQAEPNNVIACERSYNETLGMFNTAALDVSDAKGFEPTRAWQIRGRRHLTSKYRSAKTRELSALSGRQNELRKMIRHWEQSRRGDRSVLLLSGEPGLGKSRLLHEITQVADGDEYEHVALQCLPYYSSTPLHPLTSLMRQSGSNSTGVERRLKRFVRSMSLDVQEATLVRAMLLPILAPENFRPGDDHGALSDSHQDLALRAIAGGYVKRAAAKPMMIAVEDLHWADPSFMRLINHTIAAADGKSVAFFLTSRDPEIANTLGIPEEDHIRLEALSPIDVLNLARQAAPYAFLDQKRAERVVELAAGNPLWAEELAKSPATHSLASAGTPSGPGSDAVYGAIRAQLDQLSVPRRLTDAASLHIGSIDVNILATVCEENPLTVAHYLGVLREEGILIELGHGANPRYGFRHELVRVHIYDSIFETERDRLHKRYAEVLSSQIGRTRHAAYALIAYHFAAADDLESAINYWIQASQFAATTGSSAEALNLIDETQRRLRKSRHPDRARLEGTVHVALGDARRSVLGTGHGETLTAYRDAVERCASPAHPSYADALYGLAISAWMQSRFGEAENAARKLEEIGENGSDPANSASLLGKMLLGMISLSLDNIPRAREYLRSVCSAVASSGSEIQYAKAQFPSMAFTYLGWAEALASDAEAGRGAIATSISTAEQESRVSTFYALANACCFDFIVGDDSAMVARVTDLIDFAADDPIFTTSSLTKFYRAWLGTRSADTARQSVRELQSAFGEFEDDEVEIPIYGAIVARAALQAGFREIASEISQSAIQHANRTRETWCVSSLELLLNSSQEFHVRHKA